MNGISRRLGGALARYLNQPARGPYPHLPANLAELRKILRPADVILVEGRARISTAIKYLTQSTWSHVVLYVGDHAGNTFAVAATCWSKPTPSKACICSICRISAATTCACAVRWA